MLSTAFIFFCTDFVNAEERNRRAHAENGNTSVSFPAAPVQPPAPCVPQRADHYAASSLAPGPCLLHASFFPRLKEVVVDRAFFEQLCREPAAAPEAPDRGFVLRRTQYFGKISFTVSFPLKRDLFTRNLPEVLRIFFFEGIFQRGYFYFKSILTTYLKDIT